jgi:hypothetical protein
MNYDPIFLLPLLTGEEWKCFSFLIRKTLGEKKRSSKSEIAKGTGLSEGTVDKCIASLVSFGVVIRKDGVNGDYLGVKYEIQAEDTGIKWEGLKERRLAIAIKNEKRTEAARKAAKTKAGRP